MVIRLVSALLVFPVHGWANTCAERLLADSRLNWMREQPNRHRKPPDVFESKMLALYAPYLERLPRGLDVAEARFFGRIFVLLRDHRRVWVLTQELITEMKTAPAGSAIERFEWVLTRLERPHGFRVIGVHGPQTAARWRQYVSDGYTFLDHADADVGLSLRVTALDQKFYAKPGRWRHGAWSHRLQLHLVLRDLAQNPGAYGNPTSVLALYRRMGDRRWARGLDWSDTGLYDSGGRAFAPPGLFFHLFDSAENNPSSPGYFLEYHEHWPELPLESPPDA